MNKVNRNISLVFMAIYSIVFVHNIIPHHHHSDEFGVLVNQGCSAHSHDYHEDSHHHSEGSTPFQSIFNHHHPLEEHQICSFEVYPALKKSGAANVGLAVLKTVGEMLPHDPDIKITYNYFPQKLLESYKIASPLRAPPILS